MTECVQHRVFPDFHAGFGPKVVFCSVSMSIRPAMNTKIPDNTAPVAFFFFLLCFWVSCYCGPQTASWLCRLWKWNETLFPFQQRSFIERNPHLYGWYTDNEPTWSQGNILVSYVNREHFNAPEKNIFTQTSHCSLTCMCLKPLVKKPPPLASTAGRLHLTCQIYCHALNISYCSSSSFFWYDAKYSIYCAALVTTCFQRANCWKNGGRFDIFALFRKEGESVYDVTRWWPHALAKTWKYITSIIQKKVPCSQMTFICQKSPCLLANYVFYTILWTI